MAKRASTQRSAGTVDASMRVVVLHGPERFLQTQYTDALRDALAAEHGEVQSVLCDGASASLADVLDECRSFGLLMQHKLVVVDAGEQIVKEANRPIMERYAAAPPDSATLVLRCERWNKGKLDKLIEACGTIIKCDAPSPVKAAAWATARCAKRYECSIADEAASALVERVGTELGRIDQELSKLAVLAGRGGTIGVSHVGELVGLTREQEVWAIQQVLLRGDAGASIRFLDEALHISRHPPVLVSFACADLARKLHACSTGLARGLSPGALAGEHRLWGPSRDAILGAARRIKPDEASDLLDLAVRTDAATKSGRGDPERQLEALAVRLAQAGPVR